MSDIHPLWFVCIIVRLYLIKFLLSKNISKTNKQILFAIIGLGFLYKAITGSNDEVQIAKVFWHEHRIIHGYLFLSALCFIYIDKLDIAAMLVALDIFFSVITRLS